MRKSVFYILCFVLNAGLSLAHDVIRPDERAQALRATLAWIQDLERSGGRTPEPKDFKPPDFAFTYDKLVGKRRYGPKNNYRHAIYRSDEEFWLALKDLAKRERVPVSLLTVNFKNPSSQILKYQRDEAFELILRWVKKSQKLPRKRDFGSGPGQIAVNYTRLVARDQYAPGREGRAKALSPNVEDHWLAFKRYAQKHKHPVRLLDISLENPPSPKFKLVLRAEANALVLDWMARHNRLPKTSDFGSGPEQIPIRYYSLVGGEKSPYGLYPNAEHFWRQLKVVASARGLPIRLWEVTFTGSLEPETRNILKQEAHEKVLEWNQLHDGRTPVISDFGYGPGQIPIPYSQLMGISDYRKGGPYEGLSVYQSRREFKDQHRLYAQSQGVVLHMVVEKSPKPSPKPPHAPKRVVTPDPKRSALRVTLQWMIDPNRGNCRFPTRDDFGNEPYQIDLEYDRLIASNLKDPTEPKPDFASLQSFYRHLQAYAKTKGLSLRLLDAPIERRLERRTREILQQEALELISIWIFLHGNGEPPRWFDFADNGGSLPLKFSRLIATGDYRLTAPLHNLRLMDSLEDYRKSLDQYLREKPVLCRPMFLEN